MVKKREDMTPEEYEEVKKRLSAMREKAVEVYKARKEEKQKQKQEAQPVEQNPPSQIAISKKVHTPPKPILPEPTPIQEISQEIPVEVAPNVAILPPSIHKKTKVIEKDEGFVAKPSHTPDFNLEQYFDAKYKAKAKYMKPSAPAPMPVPTPSFQSNSNQKPKQEDLVQRSAKEEIANRVQNEMLKMAMKNVFPSYY